MRARVLDAALRLIRKRGDAAVTMADIAKAARLSRQAVYLHFADRADLMVALARHVNESLGLPAEIQRLMNSPTGIEMIEEIDDEAMPSFAHHEIVRAGR